MYLFSSLGGFSFKLIYFSGDFWESIRFWEENLFGFISRYSSSYIYSYLEFSIFVWIKVEGGLKGGEYWLFV